MRGDAFLDPEHIWEITVQVQRLIAMKRLLKNGSASSNILSQITELSLRDTVTALTVSLARPAPMEV